MSDGDLLLTKADRDLILAQMPAALAYVSSRLEPGGHDDRTIALGRLECLPAQGVGEGFGKAALHGYHLALDDVPADLLSTAVERCLKDVKRTFRPSPPELRAYVEPEIQERKRAKRRLLAVRDRHAKAEPAPMIEGPFDTAALLADTFARIDAGTAKLKAQGRVVVSEPSEPAEPIYGLRSPFLQQMAEDLRQARLPADDVEAEPYRRAAAR